MARFSLLVAAFSLVALAVVVAADPFTVRGRVYCDTCSCGFENNATTYIPNAVVRIECFKREDATKVVFSKEGVTDHTGTFYIPVEKDHGTDVCDSVLVSSPWKHCSRPDPGRDRARVILTDANGVASHLRHSNNLGFLIDRPLPVCKELLNYYQTFDDE